MDKDKNNNGLPDLIDILYQSLILFLPPLVFLGGTIMVGVGVFQKDSDIRTGGYQLAAMGGFSSGLIKKFNRKNSNE